MRRSLLPCLLLTLLFSACAGIAAEPLEGRVEVLERSPQPSLPEGFLSGSATLTDDAMPEEFAGKWYGDVKVMQMQTFPHLHPDPYGQQFITEILRFVKPEQHGQIMLEFKNDRNGVLRLLSSDVILRGGVRLELDSQRGPALVRGGTNIPRTVVNRVTKLPDQTVEQTRLDNVTIVDQLGRPIRYGHTEVTAAYTLKGPRKMSIKLLNIDYSQEGAPLWKVLLKGEARRW
jgi:hypothetical protein